MAVTGAFSSGKSTLLNLLLDQPDLLPASVIPMTAVCTVIRHAEQPRVRVRYVPFEECFARVLMCIDAPFTKPFQTNVLSALGSMRRSTSPLLSNARTSEATRSVRRPAPRSTTE